MSRKRDTRVTVATSNTLSPVCPMVLRQTPLLDPCSIPHILDLRQAAMPADDAKRDNSPHQLCEVMATKLLYLAAFVFHNAAHLSCPCSWSHEMAACIASNSVWALGERVMLPSESI